MPRSISSVHMTESQDQELAQYRTLSGQAVVGLLFGLASPLALVDPLLWAIPVVGIFLNLWALRIIKREPTVLAGRKRALCGLFLSLAMVGAVPASIYASRVLIQQQAQQVANEWFARLRDGKLENAKALMPRPSSKKSIREDTIGNDPLIKELLALGPRGHARFVRSTGQIQSGKKIEVALVYCVTYDEAEGVGKFFVTMLLRRELRQGEYGWTIVKAKRDN